MCSENVAYCIIDLGSSECSIFVILDVSKSTKCIFNPIIIIWLLIEYFCCTSLTKTYTSYVKTIHNFGEEETNSTKDADTRNEYSVFERRWLNPNSNYMYM